MALKYILDPLFGDQTINIVWLHEAVDFPCDWRVVSETLSQSSQSFILKVAF